ncbi:MAG: hypothetical protein K8R92_08675 [Planctomycetes bacterium]|nr:hypothetical protein [Planctomycetota bacterium]
MAIAAFFFGWWVTRNVREDAKQTDIQLRGVAWGIMSYSAATGSMPTSQESLTKYLFDHPECLTASRRTGEWPATVQALDGLVTPTEISAALIGRIEVIWPPSGNLAPVIQVRGRPSGQGTIEQVNEWLQKWNHGVAATGSRDQTPVATPQT